jgi:hypothetical protein
MQVLERNVGRAVLGSRLLRALTEHHQAPTLYAELMALTPRARRMSGLGRQGFLHRCSSFPRCGPGGPSPRPRRGFFFSSALPATEDRREGGPP